MKNLLILCKFSLNNILFALVLIKILHNSIQNRQNSMESREGNFKVKTFNIKIDYTEILQVLAAYYVYHVTKGLN